MTASIAIAAVIAASAAQPTASSHLVLTPSGPWTVEVSDGTCLVGRTYGSAEGDFTLGFRAARNDDHHLLIWRPKRSTTVSKGVARMNADQGMAFEAPYQRGPVTLVGVELTDIAAGRARIAMLEKARTLHVAAGDLSIRFDLGGIGSALKALEECAGKLQVG